MILTNKATCFDVRSIRTNHHLMVFCFYKTPFPALSSNRTNDIPLCLNEFHRQQHLQQSDIFDVRSMRTNHHLMVFCCLQNATSGFVQQPYKRPSVMPQQFHRQQHLLLHKDTSIYYKLYIGIRFI